MRARCPICTLTFVQNDYSVLQCGHAFHLACIKRWLGESKTCPTCRVRTTEREIIRQVFFDYVDQSTPNELMHEEGSTKQRVDELTVALKKETSEHCKTKEKLRTVEKAKETTDILLTRERDTVRTTMSALRERETQLAMMLQDQQNIQKQLAQTAASAIATCKCPPFCDCRMPIAISRSEYIAAREREQAAREFAKEWMKLNP